MCHALRNPLIGQLLMTLLLGVIAYPASADPAIQFKVMIRSGRLNLREPVSADGSAGQVLAQLPKGSDVRLDAAAFLTSLKKETATSGEREAFFANPDCKTLNAVWKKFLDRGVVRGQSHDFIKVIYTQEGGREISGFVASTYLSAGALAWSCEDLQRALVEKLGNEQAKCGLVCLLSQSSSAQLARDLAGPLARLLEGGEAEAAAARGLTERANALCATPALASTPASQFVPAAAPQFVAAGHPVFVAPRRIAGGESLADQFAVMFIESQVMSPRAEIASESGFRDPFPGHTVFGVDEPSPLGDVMRPNLANPNCPRSFATHAVLFAWTQVPGITDRCTTYAVHVLDQGDVSAPPNSPRGKSGLRGPGFNDQEVSIDKFTLTAMDGVNSDPDWGAKIGRQFTFFTPETARNSALQITDQMTASVSNNITKLMMVFPRDQRSTMQQLPDGRLEATLATGEKVYFDPISKKLLPGSGVLQETGWVDVRPDRFVRRVPIEYVGRGISVTSWSRTFRSPVDGKNFGPMYAEVSQADPTHPARRVKCNISVAKLWFQEDDGESYEQFRFGTDAEFYAFLRAVTRDDSTGRACRFSPP